VEADVDIIEMAKRVQHEVLKRQGDETILDIEMRMGELAAEMNAYLMTKIPEELKNETINS